MEKGKKSRERGRTGRAEVEERERSEKGKAQGKKEMRGEGKTVERKDEDKRRLGERAEVVWFKTGKGVILARRKSPLKIKDLYLKIE